jgi:L-threonylcarbamoyladenylate synthase
MEVLKLSLKSLKSAADCIRKGKVVIFPTDTVYGFIADASNKKAVNKIFSIKKRQKGKPLPVFINNIKKAKELAAISKNQEEILKKHWPGKTTFIFKKKNGKKTIALRTPDYRFLNILLRKMDKPLVQTSVNISGKPVLNKIDDIIEEFGDKVDLIIDTGNFPKRKSSKIIDLTKGKKIIRN